ncbi:MAG: PqqD family protein [Desulfatiglandales bacterium]
MENDRPQKKPNVHARKLGDEWLLYDPETERLHIVNQTAEYVWRLCDGKNSLEKIKAELRTRYDIADEQQLHNDLTSILNEFDQIGVLQGS